MHRMCSLNVFLESMFLCDRTVHAKSERPTNPSIMQFSMQFSAFSTVCFCRENVLSKVAVLSAEGSALLLTTYAHAPDIVVSIIELKK